MQWRAGARGATPWSGGLVLEEMDQKYPTVRSRQTDPTTMGEQEEKRPLFRNRSPHLGVKRHAGEGDKLTYTLRLFQLNGGVHLPAEDELIAIFRKFDADGDRVLSRQEARAMVLDLYNSAVRRAERSGAPIFYMNRARAVPETQKGKEAIERAADELFALKDEDGSGTLTLSEFTRLLNEEARAKLNKGKHWRMAPLCDVKLVLDDFVDDRRTEKVFLAGSFAGACARTAGAPLARITIIQVRVSSSVSLSPLGIAYHSFSLFVCLSVSLCLLLSFSLSLFLSISLSLPRSLSANGAVRLGLLWEPAQHCEGDGAQRRRAWDLSRQPPRRLPRRATAGHLLLVLREGKTRLPRSPIQGAGAQAAHASV